jgi:hypothetical protein
MADPFEGTKFNIIKHRGSPTEAMLASGHKVEKQEYVFLRIPTQIGSYRAGDWISLKTADYHGEHFIYIDPLYLEDGEAGRGHWFAMCTCGSPAVIVNPQETGLSDSPERDNLLVCYHYMVTRQAYGHGRHLTSGKRRWM